MGREDLILSDGRSLRVSTAGDLSGLTLVYHPGTPVGVTPEDDLVRACARTGIGLVSIARPGYSGSTRLPGRDIASVAADTADALSQLGVGDVVALGWSGGGPHALACGALLPQCRAVASLAGLGPNDVPGVDLDAGMAPENVEEDAAARAGEETLRPWLQAASTSMFGAEPGELIDAMGEQLPPRDREILTLERAASFAASIDEGLAGGVDGWVDDDLAFIKPWGFDPTEVPVPVAVWQGDLDTMVPVAHGRWLAHALPTSRPHLLEGEGHLSVAYSYIDEIVADVAALAGLG